MWDVLFLQVDASVGTGEAGKNGSTEEEQGYEGRQGSDEYEREVFEQT